MGSSVENRNVKYNSENQYSPNLSHIYGRYLSRDSLNCKRKSGQSFDINKKELTNACRKAVQQFQEFKANDQKYLATDPRGLNFSQYVYEIGLHSIHNELVTKNVVIK